MATADAIRAGRAYVELFYKYDRSKIAQANKDFASFGKGVAVIGASIAAAGASIKASLAGALWSFVETGAHLNKLSKQTGITVEALSELEYVGTQGGASLDDLTTSFKHLSHFMLEAAKNGEGTRDVLDKMGVSFDDLKDMTTVDLFGAVFDGLNRIANETERQAEARRIFGREAINMTGMIKKGSAGINAGRQEARDKGLGISSEDAKAATELNFAWNALQLTIKRTIFAIGAELAPDMKMLLGLLQQAATNGLMWARENKGLVKGLSLLATVAIVAGTAIAGVGAAIVAMATTSAAAAAVVGFLTNPWTITLGIVLAILAASGQLERAWSSLGEAAKDISRDFGPAMEAVQKAVAGGDLGLAFEIMVTRLRLAWAEGLDGMMGEWVAWVKLLAHNFMNGIAYIEKKWLELENITLKGAKLLERDQRAIDQENAAIKANEKRIADINAGRVSAIDEFNEQDKAAKARREGRELGGGKAPVATVQSKEQYEAAVKAYQEGKTKLRPAEPESPLKTEAELAETRAREKEAQAAQDQEEIGKGGLSAVATLKRVLDEKMEAARRLERPKLPAALEQKPGEFSDLGKTSALGTFSGENLQGLFGGGVQDRILLENIKHSDLLKQIVTALQAGGSQYA
jgi:hypothetical protein